MTAPLSLLPLFSGVATLTDSLLFTVIGLFNWCIENEWPRLAWKGCEGPCCNLKNSGHMHISENVWYLGFLFGLDSLLRNLWETKSMSGKTLSSFQLLAI